MPVQLSRLELLDPRQVWPHEGHDFTPWLLDNADALADVLGIDIELTAAEHPVGAFSLDLVGTDLTNNCVLMVENQLSATDHGHLGQIVTYAAGTDARTVVWMAASFREEHRQAIDFLNQLGGEEARFFGVEIGVARIGGSEPAPLFKLIAQPNDWHARLASSTKATTKQVSSGKAELYGAFWSRFLERVRSERPDWTKARKSPNQNWFPMPSSFKSGVINTAVFGSAGKLRTELYIDTGDAETNSRIFEALRGHAPEIEQSFGNALEWEDLPNRRACRIAYYGDGDVMNTDGHDGYIDWFIDTGTRLRRALKPFAGAASETFGLDTGEAAIRADEPIEPRI